MNAEKAQEVLTSDPWQSTLLTSLTGLCEALRVPDGGFTVDAWNLSAVVGGYAVSDTHPERGEILGEVRPGDLLAFMLNNGDLLDRPDYKFGGWRDPSDGRIYLDVSRVVADREQALKFARDHDQLAVWDFAAGESIPTY